MLKSSNGQFMCTLLFTNFIRYICTFLPLFLLIIKKQWIDSDDYLFLVEKKKNQEKKQIKICLVSITKDKKNRDTIGGIPQTRILCAPFMSILISLYTKHIEKKE